MKCSCPHMGNYYIAFSTFFRQLNMDFIPPPPITKRTVELGVKLSPEFVCFPFKINLGNLIEALEIGANILFQSGGRGACRYGNYLDLQEKILKEEGFDFKIFRLFDTSNIFQSWQVFKKLSPKITVKKLLKVMRMTLTKINAIDKIEDTLRHSVAYIEDKKKAYYLKNESLSLIQKIDEPKKVKEIVEDFISTINKMKIEKNPIKVGIVGELYVVMEPYSNLELEKQLMELDVEIFRPLCLSSMLREFFCLGLRRLHYLKIAKPYLKFDCCAHSNFSVAETILFAKENLDGVIHIKPHACMPEITAMSALRRVSKDYNIPLLYFSFDEHSSSTGLRTRLEAFVELLKARRKKCF